VDFQKIREYAVNRHTQTKCEYDGKDYCIHIDMVAEVVSKFYYIFKLQEDRENTLAASFCHDLVEDTRESYNNVLENTNKDVADIVLAVTDVHEVNRLMRHLYTMGKTVKDYRAIILKLCDMHANASYSKEHFSSMYPKYVEEYAYRKPIFQKALFWYKNFINFDALTLLWNELDEIHTKVNWSDLKNE
jgi:(p)ppGpp synthase/HD superfamily hydrolase